MTLATTSQATNEFPKGLNQGDVLGRSQQGTDLRRGPQRAKLLVLSLNIRVSVWTTGLKAPQKSIPV
jgi:hypothetical protein